MTFKISFQQSLAWPFTEHSEQLFAGLYSLPKVPVSPPGAVMDPASPGLGGLCARKSWGPLPPQLLCHTLSLQKYCNSLNHPSVRGFHLYHSGEEVLEKEFPWQPSF